MGEGGYLVLVNGTKYDWNVNDQRSYQMNNWNFPAVIYAGESATVYVEWRDRTDNLFNTTSDDSGQVTYTLNGTDQNFQVQASAKNGFDLRVVLTNIATSGNPQGSAINLGWKHDGYVNFILSGETGNFTSSNLPTSWMQNNLNILGNRTLRQLCMPGSHDAGMSIRGNSITGGATAGAFDCNVLTQTTGILGQLQFGARYFDIRPVIGGGQYFTGHYSPIIKDKVVWQGANGQSIQSVINDVNTYTAGNKELVVLYLSHDLNTDGIGIGDIFYPPFTQDEWNGLLEQLLGLNNLFIVNNPANVDLTMLQLSNFIGGNSAAVIVVVDPSGSGISLGDYANKGFYTASNFTVYNNYSDTNDPDQMTNDQLTKMNAQRPNPDASYFLLSWTLTQSNTEATTCSLSTSIIPIFSILDLAGKAHPPLYDKLLRYSSDKTYPNILYIDNVHTSDIAALAMAVNSVAIYSIGDNYLRPNQQLGINDTLNSPNGQYQLILQPDGNVVLYRMSDKYPLWATGPKGKDAKRAIMQPDGNFVLYDSNNNALWASGTSGQNDSFLSMQDDGNLVIYNKPGTPVWASKTN